MLNNIFSKNFQFTTRYFNEKLEAIKEGKAKFPQSVIFEGSDIYGELFFALELARILNCEKDGSEFCNCTNCNWIKTFTHPAITIVTPIDFKDMDSGSKTVISTKQCQAIGEKLLETSDYHRVFIFLNADKEPLTENEERQAAEFKNLGYELPEEWKPSHINHKIFQDQASNVILKSVEEPPKNTTFFFLTKNREDIIQTIVSRSQIFSLPSGAKNQDYSFVADLFANYPNFTFDDAFDISEKLLAEIKNEKYSALDLILMIEEYLTALIKNNLANPAFVQSAMIDLNHAQIAEKMLSSNVQPKTVFNWLSTEFVKNF